jgi:type IV fimbrial biogenesis protein FimT
MRLKRDNHLGFSLVELMISIALMGIILAIALPSYTAWINSSKISAAADSFQNGLLLARSEALKRNTQVIFTLGTNSDWTVGCVTTVAKPTPPATTPLECPAVIHSRQTSEGSSTSITITPTPSSGSTITYDGFGKSVSTSTSFTSLNIGGKLTIDVAAGGSAKISKVP